MTDVLSYIQQPLMEKNTAVFEGVYRPVNRREEQKHRCDIGSGDIDVTLAVEKST